VTTAATYSVDATSKRIGRSRRWVDGQLAANADEAGRRSHVEVGNDHVPAVRIAGRWAINAEALDAALRGEAVA
jgi:hypothetical protein